MVQITFKGHDHIRADQIIEAAQKRFALFGFEKTTMREIADDLHLSKGSLYYYFPDKESLYKAIVCKEHDFFIHTVSGELQQEADPEQMLRKMVVTRLEMFKSLINVGRSRLDLLPSLHSFMRDTVNLHRKQEKEIIRDILLAGVTRGIFSIHDVEETADLLLDLLKGLRITMLKEMNYLNKLDEGYDSLAKKTSLLIDIFIRGIRKN